MKLYRVDKLAKVGGMVVKRKHMLASNDREAMSEARESADCPVCDVLHNGQRVGAII